MASSDDKAPTGGSQPPSAEAIRDQLMAKLPAALVAAGSVMVKRSAVPAGLKYPEYRPHLRRDFFFSCGYCTMCEGEAEARRFEIDHYEPQGARTDLIHEYSNLMYSCDECNNLKGPRCPTEEARKAGIRFYRPDGDVRGEHFRTNGQRVESLTSVGKFTITALSLNRLSLRRIRDMRSRLAESLDFVNEGIAALRGLPADQIPPGIRARAMRMVQDAVKMQRELSGDIDAVLEAYAKSALLTADGIEETERQRTARAEELKRIEGMYPGTWQFRRKKAPKMKRGKESDQSS